MLSQHPEQEAGLYRLGQGLATPAEVLVELPHDPLREPVLIQQELQRPLFGCAAHLMLDAQGI